MIGETGRVARSSTEHEPTAVWRLARRRASEVAVFGVALSARLVGIATKPFWMDEVTTLQRSARPLFGLVADSLRHHQLPSYFVLTSWLAPFGSSEAIIRLPSALFGALACAILCNAGRAAGGTGAGLLAGLLLAFSPMQVQYGQEARSYAVLICMIAIALRGLLTLALDPQAAALPLRSRASQRAGFAAYTLGTIAALNVLSVALLWLVAANLAALAIGRRIGPDWRGFGRNWLACHALILVLSLPWFVAMALFVHGRVGGGLDWVPQLTLDRAWSTACAVFFFRISSLISSRLFPESLPGFGVLIGAMALGGAVAIGRRRPAAWAVLMSASLMLPASLAAISVVQPVWMPRYVLWSGMPFCLMAGLGVTVLPRRARIAAALVVGGLALCNLVPYYALETKPRWDLAAADLAAALNEGDLVLVDDPQAVKMMNIYLERIGAALGPGQWTTDVQVAAAALATNVRVWAIQGAIGQADERTLDRFLASISGLGVPALRSAKGLDIVMMRFDGDPAAQTQ